MPFARLLFGRVADSSAPGETQSRGFGEAAEAGDRAGGGVPVAAGADGSSAGGERCSRGEARTAGGGWGGAGGRGVGRAPVPCAREPERGGWVCAWTWLFHPLPDSNSDTSDLSSHCQCTRWNRKEGGREHRSSILCQRPPASHPWGPLQPSPLRAMAMPGALPSSVCWERRGGGWEAKCTEIMGGKGRVSL